MCFDDWCSGTKLKEDAWGLLIIRKGEFRREEKHTIWFGGLECTRQARHY